MTVCSPLGLSTSLVGPNVRNETPKQAAGEWRGTEEEWARAWKRVTRVTGSILGEGRRRTCKQLSSLAAEPPHLRDSTIVETPFITNPSTTTTTTTTSSTTFSPPLADNPSSEQAYSILVPIHRHSPKASARAISRNHGRRKTLSSPFNSVLWSFFHRHASSYTPHQSTSDVSHDLRVQSPVDTML